MSIHSGYQSMLDVDIDRLIEHLLTLEEDLEQAETSVMLAHSERRRLEQRVRALRVLLGGPQQEGYESS